MHFIAKQKYFGVEVFEHVHVKGSSWGMPNRCSNEFPQHQPKKNSMKKLVLKESFAMLNDVENNKRHWQQKQMN